MQTLWKPPKDWKVITTYEIHTAGEPLRVITGGLPDIPGDSILEKRSYFRENFDHFRTGLMWEPRGHADMYGAVLTEPVSQDGDMGVFFLHNEGYSTMCGHGIIALVTLVIETGMIESKDENPVVKIDTPAGRITAAAHRIDGKVKNVSFLNVSSFVLKRDCEIDVPGLGCVKYDIAFGGAFYVFCSAEALNLKLKPEHYDKLIDYGRRIKAAVMEEETIDHPFEQDLSFLYGTIFIGPPVDPSHHSRNVCVFADGEVDRSPTGTGLSARAAIHHSRNELDVGESLTVESILGTLFNVRISETALFGPYPAVVPEVTGSASIIGQHTFYFDPDDSLKKGFILR